MSEERGGAQALQQQSKYIVDPNTGVRRKNPNYKEAPKIHTIPVPGPTEAPAGSTPIISNEKDMKVLQDAYEQAGLEIPMISESTEESLKMMRDPDLYNKIGLAPEKAIESVGDLFSVREIPLGLLNKLLGLEDFDWLEFIMDDSGSMKDPSKDGQKYPTRWDEAKLRMQVMIEMLAYVPTNNIKIRFLNRRDEITLERSGKTPEQFIAYANQKINDIFLKPPGREGTPLFDTLKRSFAAGEGKKVSRYLFCDGEPTDGEKEQAEVTELLMNKLNHDNPMTILCCSNKPLIWAEEAEEVAEFCSALDDYEAELKEVLADQGKGFPYSLGVYLVCQLVASMNPDDLDALDESVPLTKSAYENFHGTDMNEEDYRLYFDKFVEAQERRSDKTDLDKIKKSMDWRPRFYDFVGAKLAKDVKGVEKFRQRLKDQKIAEIEKKKKAMAGY